MGFDAFKPFYAGFREPPNHTPIACICKESAGINHLTHRAAGGFVTALSARLIACDYGNFRVAVRQPHQAAVIRARRVSTSRTNSEAP